MGVWERVCVVVGVAGQRVDCGDDWSGFIGFVELCLCRRGLVRWVVDCHVVLVWVGRGGDVCYCPFRAIGVERCCIW